MTDEPTNEADTKGKETDNSTEDDKKPLTPTQEVNKTYEELKEAHDKVEAELLRKEELKAKTALGGQTDAGQKQETQEDRDQELADLLLKEED